MAKRCTRCGNFLMDDERFCTRCGENVSNVIQQPAPQNIQDDSFGRNTGYVSPTAADPAQNTAKPYYYVPAQSSTASDEMSLGKWVLTIIVTTFFGIISLVFLFIWGFGDGPESRKNYCKAMLIVELISIALGIVLSIIFFAVIGSTFSSAFQEYIDRMPEMQYDFSQMTAALFSSFAG